MTDPLHTRPISTILGLICGLALALFIIERASADDAPNIPDNPVQAPSEYCSGMALLAEKVAETRDRGVAFDELALLMSFLENPYHREDAGFVVVLVYEYPGATPETLASVVFQTCYKYYTTEL